MLNWDGFIIVCMHTMSGMFCTECDNFGAVLDEAKCP